MKSLNLLYLYLGKAETLILKVFSAYYSISIHEVTQDGHWERKKWNLVIFQDAIHNKVHKKHFSELLKYPWLLISVSSDIQGYMAPHPNLFGVINLSHIDLTLWGIPQELVTKLQYPAPKIADYYFYEPHPEICRIVYCPTGNNILENDFKLISFVQKTNAELIIVSDRYGAVANAFPPFVHVVSEKSWLSVFKKAHLVVASKQNAVCA